MARFLDGPAADVELGIRRCPFYLRVVIDQVDRSIDALDQLDDTPSPGELIHVYRRVEGTYSRAHACYRGKQKAQSGWYEFADYRYVGHVDDERVRDTGAWRAWCEEQGAVEITAAVT